MSCHDGCRRVVGTASTVSCYQRRRDISGKIKRKVCRVGRVGDKSEGPKAERREGERTYQQSSSRTNGGPNSLKANPACVTTKT